MTHIDSTLAERGSRYGKFSDHANTAQRLQDVMRSAQPVPDVEAGETLTPPPGWARLAPDQKQALTVIADKIARILNGDPDYIDNWHDIQGYAKLVEDRLRRQEERKANGPELPLGAAYASEAEAREHEEHRERVRRRVEAHRRDLEERLASPSAP